MKITEVKKETISAQIELTPKEYQSLTTVLCFVDTLFHLDAGSTAEEKLLIENLRDNLRDFENICIEKG